MKEKTGKQLNYLHGGWGGAFLSRDLYREFVLPYKKDVTDAVKQTWTIVYTQYVPAAETLRLYLEKIAEAKDYVLEKISERNVNLLNKSTIS